jgi:oligosaccharide 4-alpha-D-glucosyltransferase
LAYKQAIKGEPLVAPLYYYYPTDTTALNITDEFMWGENILVAPVLQKNMKERKIYLPNGKWYKLSTYPFIKNNQVYEQTFTENVDLKVIPVFVKAGSFIPMCTRTSASTTTECKTDSLTVHYYFDEKPSQYILFDDDGSSKQSIANNQFELITMDVLPGQDKLIFNFKTTGKSFKGKPVKRNIRLMVHGKDIAGKEVYINSRKSTITSIISGNKSIPNFTYYIPFDFSDKPITIAIK